MTKPDEALLYARQQALGYTNPALRDEICGGLLDHDFGIPEMARGYRDAAAASAERIKELEARVAELEGALREVADDLEAEIKARAGNDLPRRVERDLEPVSRARALLKDTDQ